jgi:DHA1 family tetracycline resistance protein-like MFS transporter
MSTIEQPSPTVNNEEKLNYKKVLPVFVIVLVDLLGLTIIIPLMPLYAASFGAGAFVIGLLGATYPLMQFIGAPLLGRLSDRYGRRPVLVVSQIGTLVGFILLGLANTLWMLFLSRIIDGISGANIATAQAVISDNTNEKTRTQGLGLMGAAFGIGFVIGPVIAFVSLALTGNDYRVPAFVAAVFSLASILLTVFWLEESHPVEKRGQKDGRPSMSLNAMLKAITHPSVSFLLVLMFGQQLAFGGFEQLLSLFTLSRLGLNASGNAVIFVFVGVIVVMVQGGFIGPWSRRLGDRRLITMGLVLLAIGLVFFAFTLAQPVPWYSEAALTEELSASGDFRTHENPTTKEVSIELPSDENTGWFGLLWVLVAMVPIAVGGAVLHPGINSLITKRVDADEVGGMLGISAAFLSAANALAPVIGGAIFQAVGPAMPFLFGGILMGVLWVVTRRVLKPGREEVGSAGLVRSASGH